jgi:tetratricopeptide (TPR) repeat protein
MRELGDRRGEAYCIVSEGNLHGYRGSYLDALGLYELAESTFTDLDEMRGVAFCASNRARVLTWLGDYGQALVAVGRALKLARRIAEHAEVAFCHYVLAELFRELGDHAEAARHDRAVLAMLREQGDRYGLALALVGAAATRLARGERPEAERDIGEALALDPLAGGMPEVEARARLVRASLLASAEDAEAAAAVAERVGLGEVAALAHGRAAALWAGGGDGVRAQAAGDAARGWVERLGALLEGRRESFLRRPPIAALLARVP